MAGNPSIRAAAPTRGHIPDLTDRDAAQRRRVADSAPDPPTTPALSAEPSAGPPPKEPGGSPWRLQVPSQYLRPSHARHPSAAPNSDTWRDYPLAEIEDLVAGLKSNVARFALFRSLQISDEISGPGTEDAFKWMNDALEDISAAALAIELASRQEFLRIRSVKRLDLLAPDTNKSQEILDDQHH